MQPDSPDKTPLTGQAAVRFVEQTLGWPMEVLRGFPKFVFIETVNQCNSNCIMCAIDFRKKKKRLMPEALYDRILAELKPRAPHLERVGLYLDCEPLLDPHLEDRLRKLKQIGIRRTYLNSNASLLYPERAQGLIEAGLDMIYITIDSLKKDRYESIRRGLKFDDVYRNTVELIGIRNRLNPKVVIRIQMILQQVNCDESDAFMRHWKRLVSADDQVMVRRAHNWGGQMPLGSPAGTDEVNMVPCIAIWSTLGIHVDGSVNLCCIDSGNSVQLGNVNSRSIAEIWHGEELRRIRDLHLNGRRAEIPICDGCTTWAKRTVSS